MTKLSKILTIVLWVILAVSAVLIVSMMSNITENSADPVMGGWINTNLVWAYILLLIGAGIALLSGIYQMVTDLAAAKKGLLAIAAFVVVALAAYMLSNDTLPKFIGVERFIADGTLTPQISRLVDTGLYATYILFGLAILSIVWSSISKAIK